MSYPEEANQAGQRSKGYWLLSRLFLEVPTVASLAELQGILAGEAGAEVPEEVAFLRRAVAEAAAGPEAAAVVFTRHLVLGDRQQGEQLPYEAHVREGKLPGEATRRIAERMTAAGYGSVAPEAPSPDHIGSELRFMALLCHAEHKAWLEGKQGMAADCRRSQRQVLTEHLLPWVPRYCQGLFQRAANGYVQGIAQLAAATVSEDLAALDLQAPRLRGRA
ncbi:MAG TPA: molecular chaperone TorD family protein [Rhodocyclaceae bacterium]|nr:molecular chaperone TorD family protein [Rhodocyclaceae bacterium]